MSVELEHRLSLALRQERERPGPSPMLSSALAEKGPPTSSAPSSPSPLLTGGLVASAAHDEPTPVKLVNLGRFGLMARLFRKAKAVVLREAAPTDPSRLDPTASSAAGEIVRRAYSLEKGQESHEDTVVHNLECCNNICLVTAEHEEAGGTQRLKEEFQQVRRVHASPSSI